MTDIATALNELGVTEWVLRGEPTNQVESKTNSARSWVQTATALQ